MKTFLYTFSVSKPNRDGYRKKSCSVYAMVKGAPVLLTTRTDSFVDEFQLVMDALEALKASDSSKPNLPARAFVRNEFNSTRVYSTAERLFNDGIASFHRID